MATALIFPGQGAQYVGMGQSLYESFPVVRSFYRAAEKMFGESFLQTCFYGPDDVLTQTKVCQPALFLHSVAAVAVLRSLFPEKEQSVAFGLSLGELTALWTAGVYDFETGLAIVAERSRLMQEACERTNGSMLCLLGGNTDDVDTVCASANVYKANLNCPGQIVLSGDAKCIQVARSIAEQMSFKRVLPLNVAGAYHSPLMESASIGFEKFLRDITFNVPQVPVLSNVMANVVSDPAVIRDLLVKQIVSPVLFEGCCTRAISMGVSEFIECGAGRTLSGLIKKIDKSVSVVSFDKSDDYNM